MAKETNTLVADHIKKYEQHVDAGELPFKEAQQKVIKEIRSLHSGSRTKSYFWLLDKNQRVIMHSSHPALEGRKLSDITAVTEEEIKKGIASITLSAGGGHIRYLWPRYDNPKEIEQKIANIKHIQNWGWTIGSSIRLSDLNKETGAFTAKLTQGLYTILFLLLLFSLYIVWQTSRFARDHLNAFSELKESKKRIQFSEQKYQGVLENMQEGYIEFDPQGAVTFFNQAILGTLGLSDEILFQTDFRKRIDYTYLKTAYQVFKRVWATGASVPEFQCEISKQSGEKIHLEMSISLLTDDKRNPTGFFCIVRDITKRMQNERELKRLRNEFKDVFDSSPSMLICVDKDRRITRCNLKTQKILHSDEDRLSGKPFESVLKDIPAVHAKLIQVINHSQPATIIRQLESKIADKSCYLDVVIYPLFTNVLQGAVLRIDDVTQRFRMEETMVQTEKMMSLGGLAAGMAHEINNPLGAISMSIQNIKHRLAPDMAKNEKVAKSCDIDLNHLQLYLEKRSVIQSVRIIQESVHRATNIITNMLHFSRKSESKMAPTDLIQIVEQTLSLAGHNFDARGKYDFKSINIIRDYASDIPLVPCTQTEIEQVLLNLFINAAYALKQGEKQDHQKKPQITICISMEDHIARIDIKDNGPGMAKSVQDRIFEPFFTTKPVGYGTGLGLSVAYMLITNNHKGSLEVKSEMGKGTRFTLKLPLERKEL